MEETASALAHAVQSGKALYVGISSYSPERTQKMVELLREWKIPLFNSSTFVQFTEPLGG